MSKVSTKTKKSQQTAEKPPKNDNEIQVYEAKISDLIPDDKNFNKGTEYGQKLLEDSMRKFGAGRSVLLDKNNRLIGGNKASETAGAIDINDVIIVETDGTKLVAVKRTDIDLDTEQGREMALADNATSAANLEWDEDAIRAMQDELDNFNPEDWGVHFDDTQDDEDEVARKEREFKERIAAGEISEEDEEYQEFLDKFKLKKTTDDCYTPDPVYNAVARWVMDEYNVNRKDFERPFYPGGDYKKHVYPDGCIVVDNPPFSILAEILQFYSQRKIKFFLFAPTLTLFSSSSSSASTAIPVGVPVIYENGASVNTSFLTNLENPSIRLRSAPTLYKAVAEGVEEFMKEKRKEIPKYTYPDNIITAPFVARLSHYGVDFQVGVRESESINQLDAQKETGKGIYGKGYIVGEKAAAEKAAATHWTLSAREMEIIKRLSK